MTFEKTTILSHVSILAFFFCIVPGVSFAQSPVADGAEVIKIGDMFSFTEGPVWNRVDTLYFSDIPNSTIHAWSAGGPVRVFQKISGSSNGLRCDKQGNIVACQPEGRAVVRITPQGDVTKIVDSFNGKKLNSPNDLWIDPQGGIYFTDPRYGNMDGMEQPGFHVYYIHPDHKQIDRVIDNFVKPNGIIGSRDGKTLIVTDAGDSKTYRFDIMASGKLSERKLLVELGSDGMALDERGNLYLTNTFERNSGVQIVDSTGAAVTSIAVPERPANLTIGGPDGKTLYITARTSVYQIQLNVGDGSDPFLQ